MRFLCVCVCVCGVWFLFVFFSHKPCLYSHARRELPYAINVSVVVSLVLRVTSVESYYLLFFLFSFFSFFAVQHVHK